MPLIAIAILLATPIDTHLWGVRLGDSEKAVKASFTPEGNAKTGRFSATRVNDVRQLSWRCRAEDRCFCLPRDADFYFVDGRLAAATLVVVADAAPPGVTALQSLLRAEGEANLGSADARSVAVGRHTRYYLRDGFTVVWTLDGPDAQIKLHADALSPVGRAEAVAAGAADAKLQRFPGAPDYAKGHVAIAERDWDAAARHFETTLGEKQAARLLREQTRLVLAMVLATRVKAGAGGDAAWKRRAKADLARAKVLAPSLAGEIDAMGSQLGL